MARYEDYEGSGLELYSISDILGKQKTFTLSFLNQNVKGITNLKVRKQVRNALNPLEAENIPSSHDTTIPAAAPTLTIDAVSAAIFLNISNITPGVCCGGGLSCQKVQEGE
jgi:hypothetical protein